MVKKKSSGVVAVNYNYVIEDDKIYEFEAGEIAYDKFGHSIKFIAENIKKSEAFSILGKRKIAWLLKNHPELLL